MGSAPRNYLSLHAVNIYVRDQERSVRFFVDQLGFDLAFDARLQSGERWVAVSPPDGSAVLSLKAPHPGTPEYKLIGRATQIVLVTDDVAARFREWSSRGVRFRHTPRLRRVRYDTPAGASAATPVWGGVFTRFQDPDGNSFQLVSFDEVSRAVEMQRQAAAEKQERERRAAREIEIAREVQARLFPQTAPALRTLEYAGVCRQARQVGGDYYDFLELGQDRLGLVVGDISGKGIAAALLMANLQANLRSQCALAADDPARFLQCVNRLFFGNTAESAYATLLFAEYDDRSRRLRYANCGHLPGLLLRAGGAVERLQSTGTVLGLFDQWDCEAGQRELCSGDVVALYTDGITEAEDDAEEQFGERRLAEALQAARSRPVADVVSAVLDEVRAFSPVEQQDDITLIVARCR
ncbi:MAG TPA: SpoIIE family protein phosphatase [Bryobacteraceae bacterium]|nr:SpoIIE family protein phosphatase [Bryobacteraceae bacterium]